MSVPRIHRLLGLYCLYDSALLRFRGRLQAGHSVKSCGCSGGVGISADNLADVLRGSLTGTARFGLTARLLSVVGGVGLLGVGLIHGALFPDQSQISSVLLATAAALVSIPVLAMALKGFLSSPPQDYTEQLVSLALLAAMASGDFITATLVPLFMGLGHFLEERCVAGTQAAIDKVRELHARRAMLLVDGVEKQVTPDELQVGDRVIVRPGEIIPADGTVVKGQASVDQAPVTGESTYEEAAPGRPVFAGAVSLDGMLTVEVTGVGNSTALGRVLELLREAGGSKSPVTRLLERYAGHYMPVVILIAAAVLFITTDLSRAIAVLVVACPCAFVLSSPTAMVAALAVASRFSILIKNTRFLESVAEVDTLVLDKTGTVTLGRLAVTGVYSTDRIAEEDLIAVAACAGFGSLHPAARAIVEEARRRDLTFETPSRVNEEPGLGMTAVTAGGTLRLGRRKWFEDLGLECGSPRAGNSTTVWLARDEEVLGSVELADRPRPEARKALEEARSLGVKRFVLLTGDRRNVAEAVSGDLGFDDYVAEVLPEQKLDIVKREQGAGRCVMVVGDGVNDAPALAGGDVGVAVGAIANEVAVGSADIAILANDLRRIPQMIALAARTRRTISLNVLVGAGFSVFMLVLAALGIITPLLGAVLHNGGAIFVLINSAQLLRLNESDL